MTISVTAGKSGFGSESNPSMLKLTASGEVTDGRGLAAEPARMFELEAGRALKNGNISPNWQVGSLSHSVEQSDLRVPLDFQLEYLAPG